MANERFDPQMSSDKIWHGEDQERCITDDLDNLEAQAVALEAGKANSDHTHTPASIGAASSTHTHTPASIGAASSAHTHTPASIGAAAADHSHNGYAASSHTHSDYANATHGHAQGDITGLSAALNGKAAADHTHTGFAAASHTHPEYAAAGHTHDLSAKADLVDGKVPASQLPSYVSDIVNGTLVNDTTFNNAAGAAVTPEADKLYNDTTTNKSYRWSGTKFVAMNESVALGETSSTAYRGDRGKAAYDHSQNGTVHVTAAQKTAWDSKAAGNHGHSYNDLSDKPTIPAAYTHPANHPASMITGLAAVATSGSYNDLENKPTIPTIPASLPANGGNADTVDNKHASDFAEASHTHEISAITGLLAMLLTDTAGRQKLTITGDVLTTIAGLAAGVHTCYSAGGDSRTATNAPNDIESWRYLVHKNYAAYGWVMAFGSEGSFFINYYDGGTWRGWKPIWDNNPAPLWTGTLFMNANQTVTPSKKLSDCKNGWVLLWSDYDTANSAATNGDVYATYIPKRCYSGGNWAGHSWLCDIPAEASATAETRCIKKVYLWNNRIVGNAINEANSRNDVVLRAVYEF